ncbi:L,D-transpeptidase [Myxococcota bacterium]|nr:L,D-transpeptidase [Myxococcota bacterium]MBU1536377.1 L,D-transpeptidase [Myxococcota bacterium]
MALSIFLFFSYLAPLSSPLVARGTTNFRPASLALSLEATRRTRVYTTPKRSAKILGAVLKGTRFPLYKYFSKTRCPGGGHFVQLGKNTFGCSKHFTLSLKFPGGSSWPLLPPGRLVHREFMKVLQTNTPAFATSKDLLARRPARIMQPNAWIAYRRNFRTMSGNLYMLNEEGLMVPYDHLDKRPPSSFAGIKLTEEPPYVIALVTSFRGATLWKSPLHSTAGKKAWRSRIHLKTKALKIIGTRRFFRTLAGLWVEESDIRRFLLSSPPPYLTGTSERWMEVNLTEQTLVAYEGRTPRFMTLVSAARKGFKTPLGAFRIFFKRSTQTLGFRKGKHWSHLFEDVPWVQFFKGTLALHTSYWHDLFGNPYSMGCIELSPKDSAFLFAWTTPTLPRGFLSISQTDESVGTLLRIVKYPNQGVNYRARSRYLKKKSNHLAPQ